MDAAQLLSAADIGRTARDNEEMKRPIVKMKFPKAT